MLLRHHIAKHIFQSKKLVEISRIRFVADANNNTISEARLEEDIRVGPAVYMCQNGIPRSYLPSVGLRLNAPKSESLLVKQCCRVTVVKVNLPCIAAHRKIIVSACIHFKTFKILYQVLTEPKNVRV